MFGPADQNQQLSNLWGFRTLQVTRALGRQLDLSPLEMRDGLSRHSLKGTPYDQYCIRSRPCDPEYRYRTIDGNCNNLVHPLWGKSLSQFNRLLPPEYSDGISELRISVTGVPLPTPRHLSVNVLRTSNSNNARFADRWNVLFMQWGQFIDHDITLGSSTRASNGAGLLCCNRTNALGPLIHPACRPIYIESNDPFYSRFNRRCNNFVRNAIGPKNNCEIGYREQSNVITAFIDGSMIYGNTYNRSRLVRSFRNGQLKTQGRNWLPFDTMNNSLACSIPQSTDIFFHFTNYFISLLMMTFQGDVRVNQQFGLIALQLLFLREHNRLARILKELNPHWDDETLFQEARKIVGAQIQHITYNEFLPEALGRNVIRHHRISLKPNGYEFGYNYELNPSILNEFAAAAFRWHTLVQKYYRLRNDRNQDYREYEMHKIFNNPSHIYGNGALDDLIRGVLFHKSERFDSIFTEDIKNLLFAQQNQRFGLDLMAINIQRGRDHGIPTYNQIRFICGLKPFNSFREMRNSLQDRNDWQHLERTYSHVNDIDFWIGGTLERPLNEGLLGPTFSCIT
ncbi:peroxinectin-like protein 6 [Sarcoptes scabiei]|uniref:Peroxinectin-like protein 6 n=1 Tax=Sarcoptes scabiei TaxID=52283 RepID=A0A132A9I4_SARSC|nr:peroxinectin-like protein 6 [Sarcoptes scabiei]